MVEPIAGVLGAIAVSVAEPILPYALAFAAGAMIYVVVDDIIPEAQQGYVVSDIFIPCPDTTARSPDSMGKVFNDIYRVGDGARCRINFAREGILVCVF
jgi:hypothetical protein